jgi:hypothetical protein
MQWIETNKKKLWLVEAIALVSVACVLVMIRSEGTAEVQPWRLGLMILPWFVAFLAAMPLVYLSWFGRASSSVLLAEALRLFYWLVVFCVSFIFVMIYGSFVFGIW